MQSSLQSAVEAIESSSSSREMGLMLLLELSRCCGCFSALVEAEVDALLGEYLSFQLAGPLLEALPGSYDLSGEEMDAMLAAPTPLVQVVQQALCPSPPALLLQFKRLLSAAAFHALLARLIHHITELLLAHILLLAFSEFGAMVFQQQVFALVDCFDALTLDGELSVRPHCAKLHWIAKLLALDAPADIKRYAVPRELFVEETQVRAILARRIDFSKEAVARVKIDLS